MSQFLFEGHYRRTPRQTLGGNSRASEDRGSLIQRADAERKQREVGVVGGDKVNCSGRDIQV